MNQRNINYEEAQRQLKGSDFLMGLAKWITLCAFFLFAVNLYVGGPTTWPYYFENTASTIGFVMMIVMSAMIAVFLSWGKHWIYKHFSIFGTAPYIVVAYIALAMIAETFTSQANQETKSQFRLNGDVRLQAENNRTVSGLVDTASLSVAKAKARRDLARCKRRLQQDKEPHCDGAQETLRSYLTDSRSAVKENRETSLAHTKLKHEREDKLKAETYNGVFIAISKAIDPDNWSDRIHQVITGVLLFLWLAFEVYHYYFGTQGRAKYLEVLQPEAVNKSKPRNDDKHSTLDVDTSTPAFLDFAKRNTEARPITASATQSPTAVTQQAIQPDTQPELGHTQHSNSSPRTGYDGGGIGFTSQKSAVSTQSKGDTQTGSIDSLYAGFMDDLLNGHMGPIDKEGHVDRTAKNSPMRSCTLWLNTELKKTGIKYADKKRRPLINKWVNRMGKEGLLSLNPDYTETNRKPKWLRK